MGDDPFNNDILTPQHTTNGDPPKYLLQYSSRYLPQHSLLHQGLPMPPPRNTVFGVTNPQRPPQDAAPINLMRHVHAHMRQHGRLRTRFSVKFRLTSQRQKPLLRTRTRSSAPDLQHYTISRHLLNLVPSFRDKLTRPTNASLAFVAPTPTPHIRDEYCPTLTVTMNDHEISSVVIDGGSRVNVSSEATCLEFGLKHGETCSFHLRMVDTSMVHPLGPITKLPIWIGGEFF